MTDSDVKWDDVAKLLRELVDGVFQPGFRMALQQAALLCETHHRDQVRQGFGALQVDAVPLVCIESPLRGDYERNVMYADAAMLDALDRDEAPFLGHLLYPRVYDDGNLVQRARGIAAHCAWLRAADQVVVYVDLGVSDGMHTAMALARSLRVPVVERTLGLGWMERIARVRPTQGF